MNEIILIPVDQLLHHPENPRKDLGDLTELAESIRKNGIMQNLTVVRGHMIEKEEWIRMAKAEGVCREEALGTWDPNAWDPAGYTVVIGNRRMEAAKIAGLKEVPCVISDMDYRTQIATMLEENMQRADLTVYEQAQGFQMMMDLGYTEKEISEKTGFSEKTVKDRIKFTKFNQKTFQEAVAKGATLMDLIEVSKLKKKKDQDEVMKEAGTNNFRHKLVSKLSEQKYEEGCEKLEKLAKEAGLKEVPENESVYGGGKYTWTDFKATSKDPEEKIRKALNKVIKANEGEELQFKFSRIWNDDAAQMSVLKKNRKKEEQELSEEEKAKKDAERARQKHLREVKRLWAEAYQLRTDFIRNYTVTNGFGMTTIGKLIIRYSLAQKNGWNDELPERHDWKGKYIKDVLGIKPEAYEDKKILWDLIEARGIPQIRATLAWIMGGGVFDCDHPEDGEYYYYDGSYSKGNSRTLIARYEFLKEIGYMMSDMEVQLMDGTHPVYKEAK